MTADQTRVASGARVILNCTVLRRNPMKLNFNWTFNGHLTSGFTSSKISSIYIIESMAMSDVGNYSCSAINQVGAGVDAITIRLGGKPCRESKW